MCTTFGIVLERLLFFFCPSPRVMPSGHCISGDAVRGTLDLSDMGSTETRLELDSMFN